MEWSRIDSGAARSRAEEDEDALRIRQLRAFAAAARQRKVEAGAGDRLLNPQPPLSDGLRALGQHVTRPGGA